METSEYTALTKKQPLKPKSKTRPLPKATQKYLEAEETLFQELEENNIGYRRKFQFESALLHKAILEGFFSNIISR
ncbi:hypothetical protein [Acinetobacter sp. 226-1]|uniref:hypothetical protein n=1 Tax=Acinetobacter sp. 226-1 TaxID=2746718 RepID=UPI0025754DA8|nr:hypothetical protein [Acinetobacter sp. 226-1]MDM1764585.1 hypothetical protein [Acinetobacter sp. 226-1]